MFEQMNAKITFYDCEYVGIQNFISNIKLLGAQKDKHEHIILKLFITMFL